ncbi:hypothetical protein RI367_004761 [Sorochytrium milnesiophthora]
MFGLWGNKAPAVLVTEADSWPGFYVAHEAYKSGKFSKVIAAVQDKSKDLSARLDAIGCDVRDYDVTNKNSLRKVARDAQCMLLIPARNNGELLKNTKMILDAARAEQTIHTVLLFSTLGAAEADEDNKGDALFAEFKEIEELVQNSKFENECVFRLGFVAQQLFGLAQVVQNRGLLPLPIKNGKVAVVNVKDVALASVLVLSDANKFKHVNRQTLTLTGPTAYNGQAMAHAANAALQSRIKFKDVSMEEYKNILENNGDATELEIEWSLQWCKMIREEKLEIVTKDLEKLLGRKPEDLEAFFASNARSFKPGNGAMSTHALRELGY